MEIIVTIVSLFISFVSVSFAIYVGTRNLKRSNTEDIETRAVNQARVEAKIDSVNKMVTDIRYDVSSLHNEFQKNNERLILVENKANRAHERIDELKESR
jgi:peptidoglycan hydrolase CwlO-like protein